jgi:hypothetical protein
MMRLPLFRKELARNLGAACCKRSLLPDNGLRSDAGDEGGRDNKP